MKYIIQLIFILFITGCSSELENRVNELIENKNKWIKSAPNRNYTYTYKHKCFCGFNDKEIKIQVTNGNVVSASLRNGKKINTKNFKTIKQHFEYILNILKKEVREESMEINVEYDDLLGFPSKTGVNRRAMDGDVLILISNLTIQ